MIKKKTRGVNINWGLLSGDEAVARGAYENGVAVAASYPGTPATEIAESLSLFSEVDCQWSVNEKVAYEVAYSAAVGGLRALFSAKHVGLNVAMDALMTSAYTGVNAGFVAVSADDPGMHSSQNEQDNRLMARMAGIPVLEPGSPADAKEMAGAAFGISEKFDIPVILRLTTRVAHSKENVRLGARLRVRPRAFVPDIPKYVMVPGNARKRHIDLLRRLSLLKAFSEQSAFNRIERGKSSLGIVASGVSYLYAREMFPDASFLKLGLVYPFPAEKASRFAASVKEVLVIEELEPFLEDEMRKAGIKCRGKAYSFRHGELRPEYMPLLLKGEERPDGKTIGRSPVMCAGCPHRQVFWLLKKMKLTVAGDIGCYSLGASPPLSSLHTCVCMGSSLTFLEGLRKSTGRDTVAVIGDSTFVHSGITGLINMGYNRSPGTVLILDNGTTAMTGNQPHPGTGITLQSGPGKKLSLEALCLACGADNVDVIDPYDIVGLERLLLLRIEEEKLSVIIVRSACLLLKKERGAPVFIDAGRCSGCLLCLGAGCPALKKGIEGKISVDVSLCNGCGLCVSICRMSAIRKQEK
ncbi:MAG: thiamine pyrophosphate-dependent enzyme [Candidatus Omnitrophota bacterium]